MCRYRWLVVLVVVLLLSFIFDAVPADASTYWAPSYHHRTEPYPKGMLVYAEPDPHVSNGPIKVSVGFRTYYHSLLQGHTIYKHVTTGSRTEPPRNRNKWDKEVCISGSGKPYKDPKKREEYGLMPVKNCSAGTVTCSAPVNYVHVDARYHHQGVLNPSKPEHFYSEVGSFGKYLIKKGDISCLPPDVHADPETADWKRTQKVRVWYERATLRKACLSQSSRFNISGAPSMSVDSVISQATTGTWYIHVRASNKCATVDKTFGPYRIDRINPTASASHGSSKWAKKLKAVTLTYSDAHSGIAEKKYAWSTKKATPKNKEWLTYKKKLTTDLPSGKHRLHYRATDNAGNVKTGYFGFYRIDKTSPTVAVGHKAPKIFVDKGNIKLTFRDTHSGIKSHSYRVYEKGKSKGSWTTKSFKADNNNESSKKSSSVTVNLREYGIWYIDIKATDCVGNVLKKGEGKDGIITVGPFVVCNKLDKPDYERWVYLGE